MLEAWSRTRDGTRKLSANFTVAGAKANRNAAPSNRRSRLAFQVRSSEDRKGNRALYRDSTNGKMMYQNNHG